MAEFKYIVTDENAIAIFSHGQNHDEMARGMWGKPIGAGFGRFYSNDNDTEPVVPRVHCYGESVSLGIKSRPEDEKIIYKYLCSNS